MALVILRFTLVQLVRQRRTLLLVLLGALPVALALLFRVTGGTPDANPDFPAAVLGHFIVSLILPLTALVVGTSALGQELEDGTVAYLVAKPIPRWTIVLGKVGASWLIVAALVTASMVVSGLIMLAGHPDVELVPAFTVAAILGALAYSAVFVMLSIRFSRALIIGLGYVFIWETLVSEFIPGVRYLSIRAYTMSIADALAGGSWQILETPLALSSAVVLASVITLLAAWYAIRRLARLELSERV